MADINRFRERVAYDFEAEAKKNRPKRVRHKVTKEEIKERITNAIAKDGGRYVIFPNHTLPENSTGLLVCGLEYENKYYFLLIDKDRQIQIINHRESYKLLREIPPYLSVLNYMYNNQRIELKKAIELFFNSNEEYKPFTDIAIRVFNKKKHNKNRKPNKNKKTKTEIK